MLEKFKRLFQGQDLTVGNTLRCILLFSIPMLIGNLAQLLYNTVDSIVIGKYVGDAALAALGSATPILVLFLVVFMAIGAGVCILVSQYYGAKETDQLGISIGNSITLITLASVVLTVVGILISGWALRLINTPQESFEMAKSYLIICFIGVIGDGFYNIMGGVIRGMGDSVFPLLILLFCTVLNTILDILFVAVFHMGVAGAAWATTIGKTVSAVILLAKVLKMRDPVRIQKKHLALRKKTVSNICRLGIPNGISMAAIFLAGIIIQGFVNKMGVMVVAAYTALMKVDSFAVIPCQTFGHSSSTFTGQNIGAGRLDRVKQGTKQSLMLGVSCGIIMVSLILIFGKQAFGLFTKTPEVINMGYTFICIMIPAYILISISDVLCGIMRGAGDAMAPMIVSMLGNVVIRIPLTIIAFKMTESLANPNGHPYANFVVMDICMFIQTVITVIIFKRGKWKNKSVVKQKEIIE